MNAALFPHAADRLASQVSPRLWLIALPALGALGLGLALPDSAAAPFLMTAGASILALAIMLAVLAVRRRRAQALFFEAVSRFVEHDPAPTFTTDADGRIGYQNRAAVARFGQRDDGELLHVLSGVFASPGAVLARLKAHAEARGAAREDVLMRTAQLRLAAHRMGDDGVLWRLEDLGAAGETAAGLDAIALPALTATRSGSILHRNRQMRDLIGDRAQALGEVIRDLPVRSGDVHEVASREGPARLTVFEAEAMSGRRELYFLPAAAAAGSPDWHFFDALPVPLLKIARSGEVELANRLARDLLDDAMAVGAPLASLVEGLGRPVGEWLADAIEGRGLNRPEVVRASRPSREVYLQITLGRIEEDGEVSLVAVMHDATELKTLEAQFVQSQKMQAIGQLAGGVAHDFNNLLTAIIGHCDLLLLRHELGDPEYADLSQIAQNANRAASLVGQLLAFSRKQNLQPQMLDIRESLSDLTHLLNRLVGEKVTLEVRHDPDLKVVRADKRQLEQVIMNLVVNARDAMKSGGRIEIATRMLELREPIERDRAAIPPGEYVEVRVRDEGTGIPPDKLPKIFEPFFTTKRTGEGTGLGLSTAYGIVKQTGGFIFAESTVGVGTEFSLLFPAHDAPATTPQAEAPQLPRSHGQGDGVILLVEDEAPVRAFASRALRMKGYTVIEAEHAEEALQILSDPELRIDLFVTDVIMPGMDGPTWVRKALVTRPETRVVFVSGYAEDSFADDQARIPNSVFLPKPFQLNDLISTVHGQFSPEPSTGH